MTAVKMMTPERAAQDAFERVKEHLSAEGRLFAMVELERSFRAYRRQLAYAEMTSWELGNPPPVPTTHDDLALDLATYLRLTRERPLTWQGVRLDSLTARQLCRTNAWPSSWGSIADVFSVGRQIGPATLCYEVKVSRDDALRDIRSGKWRGYAALATVFYFAIPHLLLGKNEIPEGVGLIERNARGWRVRRPPKARGPRADWLLLLTLIRHDLWSTGTGRGVKALELGDDPQPARES